MALIPVAVETLTAGSPLPYPLFDSEGRQLFKRGAVIDSPALLERILGGGLYRQEEALPVPGGNAYPLEAIGAGIGDEIQFELLPDAATPAAVHEGALIGFIVRQGVMVALSAETAAQILPLSVGQPCRVRLSAGKNCYVFEVPLLVFSPQPYPHLHLAYPAHVTALTQRSQARVTVNLAASVTPGTDNLSGTAAVMPVLIRNISAKGALIMAQSLLGKEGGMITLKFRLKIGGIDHIYVLAARLCRITSEPGQPPVHLHGIEFVEMDAHNIATRARRSWQTFISYLESKGKAQ